MNMMMPGRSSNSSCKRVLDKLKTLYLGGVEIKAEEGVAVILFRMDDGGGDGGGSFRVKHRSDAAKVTDVHEARDVNKDQTPKDQDKDKDLTPKDQDKDKDLTPKDQDKDLTPQGPGQGLEICP